MHASIAQNKTIIGGAWMSRLQNYSSLPDRTCRKNRYFRTSAIFRPQIALEEDRPVFGLMRFLPLLTPFMGMWRFFLFSPNKQVCMPYNGKIMYVIMMLLQKRDSR